MSSVGAAHGVWCNARTYPTRCRYCGEEVFYFSCSCGSKVFFDSLGVPWPEHNCIEYKIAIYGKEDVEQALKFGMMLPGYSRRGDAIERRYQETVQRQREADRKTFRQTVAMQPATYMNKQLTRDLGRITEVIEQVDAFRRAKLDPDSPIAIALFRELTRETMCQVTFVADDLTQADRESYTCWIAKSVLKASGAVRGDLVEFELVARDYPMLGNIWLCQGLTVIIL